MNCKEFRNARRAIVISSALFFLASAIASAAQFQWYNDPNSTVDFSLFARSCGESISDVCPDNTIRFTGIQAVNLTTQVLPDVGLIVPSAFPRIFNPDGSLSSFALTWSNDKNGWFTDNFDGSGTSLLVTVAIQTENNAPNGRVRAGSVADDQTLTQPLQGLTYPFDGVTETLSPDDLIPFVDLGSFSPFQAKFLDLIFTYDWGDDRPCCALRTAFSAYTLAPVPEPGALSLLGAGLIVLAGYRWRRQHT